MADKDNEIFGFEIIKKSPKKADEVKSFVPPEDPDGTAVISAGGHFGEYLDQDASAAKNDAVLILKYRDAASQPEVDAAIEDIVNEAIVADDDFAGPLSLNADDVSSPKLRKVLQEEFDRICKMLDINNACPDIFRRWYVDGRLYYHVIVDEARTKNGIKEIRPIDSTKIRKVRKYKKDKDMKTGVVLIKGVEEYFIYQEGGAGNSNTGLKISPDSICFVSSGLLSPDRKKVVSYLHKALKPANQLRMMEDSLVIYRLARAPERRVFYVDVGNLPKGKAEEYMQHLMTKHRNKLIYDAKTGQMRDDRKHMSMLEDFWLPRREGGRGTEISTLPGGENLGQIEDVLYFQKKLYQALNVPQGRLEQEQGFSLGRSSEISRDEVKFKKFVDKLRKRFARLFLDLLRTQMLVKGLITEDEWKIIREEIVVDFQEDNYFSELKEMEMMRERISMLRDIDEYTGKYYSTEWIRKNLLRQTDEDIKEIDKQIAGEPEPEDYVNLATMAAVPPEMDTPMDAPPPMDPEEQAGMDMAKDELAAEREKKAAKEEEKKSPPKKKAANESAEELMLKSQQIELNEKLIKFLDDSK